MVTCLVFEEVSETNVCCHLLAVKSFQQYKINIIVEIFERKVISNKKLAWKGQNKCALSEGIISGSRWGHQCVYIMRSNNYLLCTII